MCYSVHYGKRENTSSFDSTPLHSSGRVRVSRTFTVLVSYLDVQSELRVPSVNTPGSERPSPTYSSFSGEEWGPVRVGGWTLLHRDNHRHLCPGVRPESTTSTHLRRQPDPIVRRGPLPHLWEWGFSQHPGRLVERGNPESQFLPLPLDEILPETFVSFPDLS